MADRPDIFLSYSREDQATARRFAEALQQEGFTVWWDQTLSTGEAYDEVTERALEDARAVVVLWSRTSVASRWVRAEATTADRNGVLMPVMIEACKRPIMFELRQTAALDHWTGDTNDPPWRAFVADLKRLVLRGQPPEAGELLERAAAHAGSVSPVQPSAAAGTTSRSSSRKKLAAAVGLAIAVLAGFFLWHRTGGVREPHPTVAEVAALVDKGDMQGAFDMAQKLRAGDRPALQTLAPVYATKFSVSSEPAGVEVSYRGYGAPGAPWVRLGLTPLKDVEVPRQATRWRLEKAGYEPVELATTADISLTDAGLPLAKNEARKLEAVMNRSGELPAGMVAVPAGRSTPIRGIASMPVPAFFIDRHEVTNKQFKEFLDAGGYERRAFWEELEFRRDGKPLTFDQAKALFIDATGRPGPATWELGSYPQGRADHPVTGVSWYEAAAYARFRGMSLPTVYHWARAALPRMEQFNSLAVSIIPFSNFGSNGPAPAGSMQGVGPFGTYDMLGNAREWMANAASGNGMLIGGSWTDAKYSYNSPALTVLLDRSEVNGFRLMKDGVEAYDAALLAPIEMSWGRVDMKPVSDDAFATLRKQFEYGQAPLNASAPETLATTEEWTKQRVTIDTGYEDKRMDVVLFVPRHAPAPFQPVLYFPGGGDFQFPSTLEDRIPGFEGMPLDFVIRSGRMLVYPVYEGSANRFREPAKMNDAVIASRMVTSWRADIGRTIDYLQTRPDLDIQRLGYLGVSMGGTSAVPAMAVETRFKAAVLISGGILPVAATPTPLTDSVNFAPRIRIPVLMFNGRYDPYLTVENSQQPLFRLLGSPAADKRYVQADFAHVSPPRAEMLREVLGWYDKYLGKVSQ